MYATTQAAGLRALREARVIPLFFNRRRFIAVSGVKGGIGKSTLSVNLAYAFHKKHSKVVLVDGDMGLADLNLMLGVAPDRSLADLALGMPVLDCLAEAHGLTLLPGLNGSYDLANADSGAHGRIMEGIKDLRDHFETVIIDSPAGIERNAIELTSRADEIVVVVTPQPAAIADAYAVCKVLHNRHDVDRLYLLVNNVRSDEQGHEVVENMTSLAARFLPELELVPLPFVPHDGTLSHYASLGMPALAASPDAPGPRAVTKVARALDVLASDPQIDPEGGR